MAARVLVTGFEPFGSHRVNPSWQTAKTLEGCVVEGALIVTQLLPVEYGAVPGMLDTLWSSQEHVQLCVHCGVGLSGRLCIEQRARNHDYTRLDNKGVAPPGGVCVAGAPAVLETGVNVAMLMERLRLAQPGVDAEVCVSLDAGRYLCEFTYFYSLQKHRAPVLFVHVPPLSDTVTIEVLRARLVRIITCALQCVASKRPGLLRPQVGLGVVVTSPRHPGCVLVGRRIEPGALGHGTFGLPGGHVEFGESVEHCAVREVAEECDLALAHVRQGPAINVVDMAHGYHYVVLFAQGEAEGPEAEPINREPHKCEGWVWAAWQALPSPLFRPLQLLKDSGYNPFPV